MRQNISPDEDESVVLQPDRLKLYIKALPVVFLQSWVEVRKLVVQYTYI